MPTGLGDEQLWISATNDNTGTSTAFNDQSGNGNNGTASGTLVVADTSEGGTYAYEFDGTDDRIDCPSTVLGGSQVFSMSCWVYVDSHDATYGEGFMGQWDNNASSNKAGMIYSGAATSFRGLVTAGGTNYTSTVSGTSPPTGSWHHLASVVDGSNVTLYVDGVSQGATAYSGSISSSPANAFEIGRYQGSFGANDRHCLDGKMDDIRAYNRVLTQAEIVHLAEARGIEGPPPVGLGDEKLWWCPSINDSANDISGNGNDGSYGGNMTTVADTDNGGSMAYFADDWGDYVAVDQFGGPLSESRTVSYWIKRVGTGSYTEIGTARNYFFGGGNNRWVLQQGSTYVFWSTSSSTYILSSPVKNTWEHVTIVRDNGSGDAELYLDGTLVDTWTPSAIYDASTDPSDFFAGMMPQTGNATIDLYMDDIRTYDRTLTQAEITHLASSRGVEGTPPVGLGDEQLWLCPSLNDSDNDISGNGNNGTLIGGTAIVSDSGFGGTKSFESYTTATDRVDIPAGVFTDGNDVSFSLWVKNKQTTAGAKTRNIFRSTNNDIQLYANQNRYRGVAGGVTAEDTLANLNTTEYYHYALNYDNASSSIELFRNGVSVATASGAASTTLSGTLDLLQNSIAFIDDIRAYNRKLTTAEIVHLASGRGTTGTPRVGLGSESLWVSPTLTSYDTLDITGNGNTALIDGTVPVVEDATGYESFQTDNTTLGTDYVYFDSPTGTTDPAAATMAFWAKSNFSVSYAPIGGFCTSGFNDLRFFIARKATTGAVRIYRKTTSSGVAVDDFTMPNGTTDFLDQNMHHWCLVFEGGKNKLYFDGVFIGESPSALSDNLDLGSTNFSLGSQDGRGTAASASNYDDIRFYDSALTPAEVFHLSTSRGVQGTSDIPAGLGTETGWWMPTYSEDNPNTPNIASSTLTQYNIVPTNIDSSDFVVDTDNGGEWAALSTYSTSINHENRVVTGIKSQVFDTGGWTMTGWVKTVSPTNTQHLYDTDGGWVFRMQNGVFRLLGGINFTTTTTVPNNQWFHFAMSVDSNRTNYKFYMDGVLEETHTDSAFPTTGTDAIYISAQQSGNYNINGRWDDFRLFDTQISDADVATLASSRGGGGSTPPSSVFYNPFKSHAFKQLFQTRLR